MGTIAGGCPHSGCTPGAPIRDGNIIPCGHGQSHIHRPQFPNLLHLTRPLKMGVWGEDPTWVTA